MVRPILSNTGSLTGLAHIARPVWLWELFGIVTVTSEVVKEIFAGKGGGDEVLI